MEDPRKAIEVIKNQEKEKMQYLSTVYGSHLPFRLVYERNVLSKPTRFGFPSSRLGLEVVTGKDTALNFPEYSDEGPTFTQELSKISFN